MNTNADRHPPNRPTKATVRTSPGAAVAVAAPLAEPPVGQTTANPGGPEPGSLVTHSETTVGLFHARGTRNAWRAGVRIVPAIRTFLSVCRRALLWSAACSPAAMTAPIRP